MTFNDNEHGRAIAQMLPQLMIAMVKKSGGTYSINVSEIDQTGNDLLSMQIDENQNFIFNVMRKQ